MKWKDLVQRLGFNTASRQTGLYSLNNIINTGALRILKPTKSQ